MPGPPHGLSSLDPLEEEPRLLYFQLVFQGKLVIKLFEFTRREDQQPWEDTLLLGAMFLSGLIYYLCYMLGPVSRWKQLGAQLITLLIERKGLAGVGAHLSDSFKILKMYSKP